MEDYVDFFTLVSVSELQLVFGLDHSQYKKQSDDAHACKNFNLHPGGSSPFSRSLEDGHDSIGTCHHVHAAKPGDIIHR